MSALKIVSYNILEGGCRRLPLIIDLLRKRQPDVVALLEADRLSHVEQMANELGMTLTYGESNCPSGVAWLSRTPPLGNFNHRIPELAKTLLEIELPWEHTRLHLFATHLASRWDPQEQADEVVAILELLAAVADSPHVLVGDMNALRPGDAIGTPPVGEAKRGDAVDGAPRLAIGRLLEAGYVDCFRQRHPRAPGFTYPATAPWLRLDYIFAWPPLAKRIDACNVIDTELARRASDHLAVWARFG